MEALSRTERSPALETDASKEPSENSFDYETAFCRNLGWLSWTEQQILRHKKVAIAGLGGVGGSHALTLARLGIGAFHLADFDRFDLANMNRQAGAFCSTIGKSKAGVISAMVRDINPDATIEVFPSGVTSETIDAFLKDVDLFIDGLDFFVLDVRRQIFARAYEKGIPAITAAPLGLGAAYLSFLPGQMSFEDYFQLEGESIDRQYVKFMVGLAPKGLHRKALIDQSRVDFNARSGPSTAMACQMASSIVGTEALKILLKRGKIHAAPKFLQFDPYGNRFHIGRSKAGNKGLVQRLKIALAYRWIKKIAPQHRPHPTPLPDDTSDLIKILDLARWAPSGDNEQPWRFEIRGERELRIHLTYKPGENIYEYAQGRPILLAAGALLETIRLAATRYGYACHWTVLASHENAASMPIIDVTITKDSAVKADRLADFITSRSVDRRAYRSMALDAREKASLETCLGPDFQIDWYENLSARWSVTRLNMMASRIRLTSYECFKVHKKAITFEDRYATYGLPAGSVGLDALTLRIMRWAMRSWWRSKLLNKYLGSAIPASLQIDLLPGLRCAAHFFIRWRDDKADRAPSDWIAAGRQLQRFWLQAESIGLSVQPGFAPTIFSSYASQYRRWHDKSLSKKAEHLAERFEETFGASTDAVVFPGRIGRSNGIVQSRSIRLGLQSLILEGSDAKSKTDKVVPGEQSETSDPINKAQKARQVERTL